MHGEKLAEKEEIMAWGREDKLPKTCSMLDPNIGFMVLLSAQVCASLALKRARKMQIQVSADARQFTDHTATKCEHLEKDLVVWLIYRDLLAKINACI